MCVAYFSGSLCWLLVVVPIKEAYHKNLRRLQEHNNLMASAIATIDTQHDDMIHDTQFDYYSKRLATCSSDRTIKIFEVIGEACHNSATLRGHEGPVWQVAWAHPKFGVILASCSYDGTVIIHREVNPNSWSTVYQHRVHESSVNSVSWAPHEYGLILACASSDGRVSILEYKDDAWSVLYSDALII